MNRNQQKIQKSIENKKKQQDAVKQNKQAVQAERLAEEEAKKLLNKEVEPKPKTITKPTKKCKYVDLDDNMLSAYSTKK